MKKFLLIGASIFLSLTLLGLITARVVYQKVVESDSFREDVAKELTKEAQIIVSGSVVDIKSISVSGLVDIEMDQINVRNSKRANQVVTFKSMKISPDLWSLITFGPIRFDSEVAMLPGGNIEASGKMSLGIFSSGSENKSFLDITGKLSKVDAVGVVNLIQSAQNNPYFKLAEGTVSGSFYYLESGLLGEDRIEQSGHMNLEVTNTKWVIDEKNRSVDIERLPIQLTLRDNLIKLENPVRLVDNSGTATLNGSIVLAQQQVQEKSWDIQVDVAGSQNLLLVVASLFRCQALPESPRFSVTGPFAKAQCESTTIGG